MNCGPPPEFPNAKVALLSGSTDWNDIAVYSCIDGYVLHRGNLKIFFINGLLIFLLKIM